MTRTHATEGDGAPAPLMSAQVAPSKSTTFLGVPAPRGVGHLRGSTTFPKAARAALQNTQLRRNLAKATTTIRGKRAAVVEELPDWEALREAGRGLKDHALTDLGRHLLSLESAVLSVGGQVH